MGGARDVAVFVGSLRKESFTRKLARALGALAPVSLQLDIVEIGQLAIYNQDFEEHVPESWSAFRDRVRRADAVLFVTPEYNRSVPSVLKNAIDVGSRPYGHSAWNAKPGAVISCSPGAIGAFGANHHLRQMLAYLNVFTLQQPEAYIGGVNTLFDEQGAITKPQTEEFLRGLLSAFAGWIERLSASPTGQPARSPRQ